ncbi:MAG: VWA domain-containing protein [Bacteroidetes bacterium]|nr:VWA domain-containing protein [Bacteroidota bacterium]
MNDLFNIQFDYPWVFALLPLGGLFAWLRFRKIKQVGIGWKHPVLPNSQKKYPVGFRQRLRWLPNALRALVFLFIVVALARPRGHIGMTEVNREVVDIQLALDISISMKAKDFSPDRLGVSKRIAAEFIEGRPNDRIGLVIFSGESFTQCPATLDHEVLQILLSKIETGMLVDGTAIGAGLGTAVARLKDSESTSKVVILLTDGVNNSGNIAPATAAEIAKTFGVRVYTIGVGKKGSALSPVAMNPNGSLVFGMAPVEIDENLLKDIAAQTGGKYFRAENEQSLKSIFEEIDTLEKTLIQDKEFYVRPDLFWPVVALAALLLLLEWVVRLLWFKSVTEP